VSTDHNPLNNHCRPWSWLLSPK